MTRHIRIDKVQPAGSSPSQVRAEVERIEARLAQIAYDGDCAYEKAMVRFYEQEVSRRRAWLGEGPPE